MIFSSYAISAEDLFSVFFFSAAVELSSLVLRNVWPASERTEIMISLKHKGCCKVTFQHKDLYLGYGFYGSNGSHSNATSSGGVPLHVQQILQQAQNQVCSYKYGKPLISYPHA